MIAIIGYGEAAKAFTNAPGWRGEFLAYDVVSERSATRTLRDALRGAEIVLSLVTADQALSAARGAARVVAPGALYFDMNSVAPQTKRAARDVIEAANARYVDVAIMAPVHPTRLAVPLLISGSHAGDGALSALGFENLRAVGLGVGRASAIKMIRSVMVKGIEALTAEMMAGAEAADVVHEVLASLGEEWEARAAYNLERMATHGARRAAEMEEAAATLDGLGVEPVMTRGTVRLHQRMAAAKLRAAA